MADVVVVGAGLGGLACAARLAKLGHSVVVCERDETPGGMLGSVERDGFRWDAVPMQITLPAVLRDLFRKSGRPLEGYVDLQLSTPACRHVFEDGTVVDLPTGSRAAQQGAISAALGERSAAEWTSFVDEQADLWERLRSKVLDVPQGGQRLRERKLARELLARHGLDGLLRKRLRDERLRWIARYPVLRQGRSPASAPAYLAVESYVERTFGVWHAPTGAADLSRALEDRMSERKVEMRYGCDVSGLTSVGDQVTAVMLADGEAMPAQVVVVAADGPSGDYTHLGLAEPPAVQPLEVVLHGDPPVAVFAWGRAPSGHVAWTVRCLGPCSGDLLDVMASRGMDVRGSVVTRLDSETGTPDREAEWPDRPLAGVFRLGTDRVMGTSWPYVAWEPAHVAALVGKA